MKIANATVKTIYDITLDSADFAILLEQFHDDKIHEAMIPDIAKVFDWIGETSEHVKEEQAITVMKQMFSKSNKPTLDYIARTLGFDGWDNAGYYNANKKLYIMSLYNKGDTLNA